MITCGNHKVGDRGQRFEITYFCVADNCRKVLGWTNTIEDAQNMCSAVDLHPSWEFPQIRDRSVVCEVCGCIVPHQHLNPLTDRHHWYAIDLDGTLTLDSHPADPEFIGEPNQEVVDQVKKFIEAGKEVRIFTARVSKGVNDDRNVYSIALKIQDWCKQHLGIESIPVTNVKSHGIIELWDDRSHNPVKK